MSVARRRARSERLAIGPASRLVGVDPGTLRRWANDGRLTVFATAGGHRRFDRGDLERIAASRRRHTLRPMAFIGATPERLTRAYRRSYRSRADGVRSATAVARIDREAFRQDGRHLVEALLTCLDASDDASTAVRLGAELAAETATDDMARRLAGLGVGLSDAVASFASARRPFLTEIGQLVRRRALDPVALASLYDGAGVMLDRLLLRFITTHQTATRDTRVTTAERPA